MKFPKFKIAGLMMVLLLVAAFAYSEGAMEYEVRSDEVVGRWISELMINDYDFVVFDLNPGGTFKHGWASDINGAISTDVSDGSWKLVLVNTLIHEKKQVWFYHIIMDRTDGRTMVYQVRTDGKLCAEPSFPPYCYIKGR